MLALVAVLAALPAAPAHAAPETSAGVRLVTTIPERGVISARVIGQHLYVSSLTGVTVLDISNPQAPVRVGRLDMPNAQNEDVDAGSGILLVSDDPFGGRGILHVIDVHDPANPRLLSTYGTWAPGLLNFNKPPPRRGGIGHTATCIQQCRYAWLAGSSAGIEIVDLRDPAHPRRAGRFRAREVAGAIGTHDVQVDAAGLAWVAGGRGTAAYDVTDPVHPRLVKRTDRRGSRGPLNNFIHHNSLRLAPDVLAITEEDFGDRCKRAGTLQTWRIGAGRALHPLDSFGVERDPSVRVACSAHYFDASNGLIAQGFYEQGVRLIDASRPRRLRQVGYYLSRPGLFWGALFAPTDPTGSTVYALDHSRGIDVLALDRAALKPVRRRGSALRGRPKPGFGLEVFDGWDAVRPGQRLRIVFGVGSATRDRVSVRATLPAALVDVRVPQGAGFDPATRTLRFTLSTARFGGLEIRARVAASTPIGTPLETIGYVTGPDDPMPLDDRGVDRAVVARRAARTFPRARSSAVRTWRGFCALPYDYTF
jgi:LVIVD repeat